MSDIALAGDDLISQALLDQLASYYEKLMFHSLEALENGWRLGRYLYEHRGRYGDRLVERLAEHVGCHRMTLYRWRTVGVLNERQFRSAVQEGCNYRNQLKSWIDDNGYVRGSSFILDTGQFLIPGIEDNEEGDRGVQGIGKDNNRGQIGYAKEEREKQEGQALTMEQLIACLIREASDMAKEEAVDWDEQLLLKWWVDNSGRLDEEDMQEYRVRARALIRRFGDDQDGF